MKRFLLLLSLPLIFFSCKEEGCTDPDASNYNPEAEKDCCCEFPEPNNVQLRFFVEGNDGQAMEMNQVTTDAQGRDIRFELFNFYVSYLRLVSDQGDTVQFKEVALLDLNQGIPGTVSGRVSAQTYTQLLVGYGLDSALNNLDPNTFAPGHPLSYAANTHWGWLKYRFHMVEGRLDTDGNGSLDQTFAYHTGLDSLYQEVAYPINLTVDQSVQNIDVHIDFDALMTLGVHPIDPKLSPSTHMANSFEIQLGEHFAENFAGAGEMN